MVPVSDSAPLADLLQPPPGVAEAAELIDQIDSLLRAGLAGGRGAELIARIGRVFEGTSLAATLADRLPPLLRGELQAPHVLAVAAARAALQGARYTALHAQAQRALGRTPIAAAPHTVARHAEQPLAEVAQHWLIELAVAGFGRLDLSALWPFLPTLARMRAQPDLADLAFLLTGLADELLAAAPAGGEQIPLTRWADLWSAALTLGAGAQPRPAPTPLDGSFTPLGVEQRESAQLVSLVVHGLLATADGTRPGRITRARYKVGAIAGANSWLLFPDLALVGDALSQGRALQLRQMGLSGAGDLIWDAGRATPGAAGNQLAEAARALAPGAPGVSGSAPLAALHRHPIQLAEPLMLRGVALDEGGLDLGEGKRLPFDPRWGAGGALGPQSLAEAASIFGLLRFDAGRWAFQPLSAQPRKGKPTFAGQEGAKLLQKPPKQHPVAILEERASRLLRR